MDTTLVRITIHGRPDEVERPRLVDLEAAIEEAVRRIYENTGWRSEARDLPPLPTVNAAAEWTD